MINSQLIYSEVDTPFDEPIIIDGMTESEICSIIKKAWIEVQNGLPVKCIVFSHRSWSTQQVVNFLLIYKDKLLNHESFIWFIRSFLVCCDNNVLLIIFSKNNNNTLDCAKNEFDKYLDDESLKKEFKSSILKQSIVLSQLNYRFKEKPLSNNLLSYLCEIAKSNTLTTSTLAAEILSEHGYLTIPKKALQNLKFIDTYLNQTINKTISSNTFDPMFEDRIDVHSYNFFELVHPAYAKQCVALACFINKYITSSEQQEILCVDVGSGPGTSLNMLMEMIPNLKVHAIEPSEITFTYLQENTKDNKRIFPEKASFLELERNSKLPLITSIGSSHHFNTYFFFQKAYNLLEDDGLLLVADEFVSFFQSNNTRDCNLILHHTAYMISILFDPPAEVSVKLTSDELKLIQWFKDNVPLAAYFAYINRIDLASRICRELLSRTHGLSLSSKVSDPFMFFYRLQILELEALVAGLDYEVEQKTYHQKFCQMANATGFSILEHFRIHPTIGNQETDAGTHVFAFRKMTS